MAAPLHPDCLTLLDMVKASGRPAFNLISPEEARELYAAGRPVLQPPPPEVAEARDLTLPGGNRARLYRPAGSAPGQVLPGMLYMHGGGWVFGDIDTHDHLARSLANEAGCAVLSVDYRLAPEHRFPAAIEDCAAAFRHMAANAASYGMDPARLAVGGDSAGGSMAAVLALMARDGALPPVKFQLLLYPATDMAMRHESYARFTGGVPLTTVIMEWFRDHYAPDPTTWNDWRASPLRASSLAGTAPAYVLTVAHDPLCDEGRDYAARLEREGVRVQHLHAADMLHGMLTMGAIIRPAATYISGAAAALRDGLA
ncbi:alpha/beta hydrolase [Roseococcus suduntuyensis]|uniref:Acetyl esterase n=1 Tax=Roseococcus suduntuyensis TaxID=455361 RepID=A0A840A8X8_9PROT|nr:alpha/beta hydrolase [Roseococcus suduntuyensis]MBB3897969.1 acetyl esterase [Roseococcus suduntuyensis]